MWLCGAFTGCHLLSIPTATLRVRRLPGHRLTPGLLSSSPPGRFEVRIEAMVLREEFFPSCAVMSREIDVVRVATKGKRRQCERRAGRCSPEMGDPDI